LEGSFTEESKIEITLMIGMRVERTKPAHTIKAQKEAMTIKVII
jgi:hypothetical protein